MTRFKPLPSVEELRNLFIYDSDRALLLWKISKRHGTKGKIAGWVGKDGYRYVRIDQKNYLAHRLIWKILHGEDPCGEVDHMDRGRESNSPANLRDATSSKNNMNRSKNRGKDLPKGVYLNRSGKYAAQIKKGGVHYWLGLHLAVEAAQKAYMLKAIELFGEYACDGE